MRAEPAENPAPGERATSLVTVGFGTTVAMWGAGYVGRIPAIGLPSPFLLACLLLCLVGGGVVLGRHTGLGWRHGALAGSISGTLNLLILGSFLGGSGRIVPSALTWIPGSILVSALLVGAGAALGAARLRRRPPLREWTGAFARVAIGAALLLLAVGGVVTSTGAGLAVVDWPNSFGYNMFLYPFSRMTGGIYYEHAHRLIGALVGLTTLTLGILLQIREPRRLVRALGWLAVTMVIVQGVLGGLRVTGGFTLSTSAEITRPNLALAMAHAVFGQLFFGTLVAIGAVTSHGWRLRSEPPADRADRLLAGVVVAALVVQLILGAAQRHFAALLFGHIVVGVALVAPLALHLGFRTWGRDENPRFLRSLGLGLVAAVGLQVLLGFGSYAATGAVASGAWSLAAEILITTAHQWFGAILLGLAILVFSWTFGPAVPLLEPSTIRKAADGTNSGQTSPTRVY